MSYLAIESIPSKSLSTDTVIGSVGVLTLCERVTVEEIKLTLIVISTPVLNLVFHREAVITDAFKGAEHVLAFSIFANLDRQQL